MSTPCTLKSVTLGEVDTISLGELDKGLPMFRGLDTFGETGSETDSPQGDFDMNSLGEMDIFKFVSNWGSRLRSIG